MVTLMHQKVLIFTATEAGNKFTENFSCWCAGALEAKGCHTTLEMANLNERSEQLPKSLMHLQREKLKRLENHLTVIDKLVLILPEYNNMLPAGLEIFIDLMATTKQYTISRLVSIIMDTPSTKAHIFHKNLAFTYSLAKLDSLLGATLSASRMQISNDPQGNMCNIFSEHYNQLCTLIQQIIN